MKGFVGRLRGGGSRGGGVGGANSEKNKYFNLCENDCSQFEDHNKGTIEIVETI